MSPRKLSNILTALTVAAFALTAAGTLGVPTNGGDPVSAPIFDNPFDF